RACRRHRPAAVGGRRDELHGGASRRTSRGGGPAVRGETMIKVRVPGTGRLGGWPEALIAISIRSDDPIATRPRPATASAEGGRGARTLGGRRRRGQPSAGGRAPAGDLP